MNICNVCPNSCNLDNQTICGEKPEFDSLEYVEATAVAIDPIEKKPLYHFLPGTETLSIGTKNCNIKCLFCQNHSIAQPSKDSDVYFKRYTPEELVDFALEKNLPSISWTYNEPTIHYKWIIQTAEIAREEGIKTVLVTNGYNTPELINKLSKYVDAVNVDIKSIENQFYREVCYAQIDPVLNSVETYYKNGDHIEITNLLIPGYNDSLSTIRGLVDYLKRLSDKIPLHFSAFYPQYKMMDVEPTSPKIIDKACDLAKYMGLKYVYPGNVPSSYKDNTICKHCRQPLIKRVGYQVETYITNQNACSHCNHKADVITF